MSQSDFVNRGQALVASGQFQEAVKVCRLGLLGRPTTVEGRIVLGQALLALKRYDEVLAEMRVALELDHTSVAAQVLKAEALLRKSDVAAAIETLHAARQLAPGDPRILQLLGEAEHSGRAAPSSASHPAVEFVASGDTKHYPNHPSGTRGDEDSGPDSYTRPTSLAVPGALRRTSEKRPAMPSEELPSQQELAVGDKSGTVEVDPDLEGVELDDDIDFDALAAPPAANRPGKVGGARGSVKSAGGGGGKTVHGKPKKSKVTPAVELEDDDIAETRLPEAKPSDKRAKLPGPARNVAGMPSGPIDAPGRPLARELAAAAPRAMQVNPLPPTPLPPPPRAPIASALPTMAAPMPQPYPQPVLPAPFPSPASVAAAARPTIALQAQNLSLPQQQSAAAVDALFGNDGPAPVWAKATVAINPGADPRSMAAALEPTARPAGVDPAFANVPTDSGAAIALEPSGSSSAPKPARTGMRRTRSRLQVVVWIVIGVVVIGGGVFAGFQIRAIRLQKQIAAARDHATDLAKADTWTGWTAARDSLAGIVQASGTVENRAALARARALIAFEFGDGVAEAKVAVEQLAGQGGLDGALAAAYLALAQSDPKAAKLAADAALSAAPQDAAALYVAGQAAALGGDPKAGIASLRAAFDHEPRPLFGVGLSRGLAAASSWEDAGATLDRVLAGNADQPAAVIARGALLAASGRVGPGSTLGNDVHIQLQKIVAEGRRPPGEQPHGVSPAQVAFGNLALAQVDFAHGDVVNARGDINAAAMVGIDDDQRFAEEVIDTLVLIGELQHAAVIAETTLKTWPASRRARLALAEIALAGGKANDALELIAKQPELIALPRALALRGQARLATEDLAGARADFDAALKKVPNLEVAVVGRAWLELAAGNVDEAKQAVEPRISPNGSSPALTTAYAATLRASGELAKAKALLEKVIQGPPGPDLARAQLEIARVHRDLGEFHEARVAYGNAIQTGNVEARFESALLLIDDRDPGGGRDTLDALLKEQGDHATANLVLETARARMLVGDHAGATALLQTAEKLPNVAKWKLARERGRLHLRRGDVTGATLELGRALEASGDDAETFLLAADAAAAADEKSGLADKIKKLLPIRLKGKPEASIVSGKLLIAAEKYGDAEKAYRSARDLLKQQNAAPRRLAQAEFGLAVAAYNLKDAPQASIQLEIVTNEDPSLYDAYLFAADLMKDKDKKKALDLAEKTVRYNPDYATGWLVVGRLASAVGNRKLLSDAVSRLGAIAPSGDELKELQKLLHH